MKNRRLFGVFSKANDKKIYAYCDDQPNVIVNLLSKTKTSFCKQKSGNIIRLESRSMKKSCRFWTFPWKSAISMPSHGFLRFSGVLFWIALLPWLLQTDAIYAPVKAYAKHAYATMLYMGTPHDHDFFVAARVMMQTLARLKVDADLVVIISDDVPKRWIHTFNKEGVRVVSVSNIENPYRNQANFDLRFMFTLNKIYAWSLLDYERVIMLDTDNLFLRKTDELFQCGKFCAVFINPCIFHTGLFVLEPSNETFHDLLQEIKIGRTNKHGADQGFLMSYFENLLEKPLFWPPSNGSKLTGLYRLPLGYQMDASYFYLRLRWNVPCGPNSVITFPSLPRLKPWYWWSWPLLPLGISWHEQRRATIGYGSETPLIASEGLFYILSMIIAMVVRRRFPLSAKSSLLRCIGRPCPAEGISSFYIITMKTMPIFAIIGSFVFPFYLVPTTVHPLIGWATFFLGSLSLLLIANTFFKLPTLAGMIPWLGIVGAFVVMASPFYINGIIRFLSIGAYACLVSPFMWWALTEITASRETMVGREPLMQWANTRQEPQSELMKIY